MCASYRVEFESRFRNELLTSIGARDLHVDRWPMVRLTVAAYQNGWLSDDESVDGESVDGESVDGESVDGESDAETSTTASSWGDMPELGPDGWRYDTELVPRGGYHWHRYYDDVD